MKKVWIISAILIGFFNISLAQKTYWEMGVGAGGTTYWGDLNSDSFVDNFMNFGYATSIHGRYNYGPVSGRLAVTFGKLRGTDKISTDDARKARNLDFHSPISEVSLLAEYNIFGFDPSDDENIFSPYVAIGGGFLKFDPRTKYNDQVVALQPLGTEGQGLPGYPSKYKLTEWVIPMGGGVKFKLTRNLVGSIEMLGRITFTDYLDDVSTEYAYYEELLVHNGELSANLSQRMDEFYGFEEGFNSSTTDGQKRGGSDVNDYYITFMVHLSYRIGNKLSFGGRSRSRSGDCPKF